MLYCILHTVIGQNFGNHLLPGTREALERYIQKLDLNFEGDDEMQALMKTKRHEALFLGRPRGANRRDCQRY
jgi:hypothetical protein